MKVVGKDGKPNANGVLNPNANLADSEEIKCEKCEGVMFEEKMMIRKLSKFITGADRDSIIPVPIIVCSNCNHMNEMFKPNI